MTYFILAASTILAIIFIAGIVSAIRERGRSDKGRVYLPGTFAWLGGIGGGLFLIPTLIILLTTDESPWLSFVFLCISMLGGVLSLAHLNCRITYDQESFTHKNFLGIKRTYTYDQITGLKEGTHEDIFYMGRHFAMIDEYSVGAMEFEIMAKKRYQALSGGKPIPRVKPKLPDPFNGHVEGGAGLIVVYIGVTLLFLALLGWFVADVYLIPPSPEENKRMEMVFDRAAVRGDCLYLYPADESMESFQIRHLDGSVDPDPIKAVCDGTTTVTVYADRTKPKNGDPYYLVEAVMVDDTVLFSFEDEQRLRQNEYWPLIPFIGGFILLWCVYIFFSIRVGRNPDRYSKKIIRLFFRDGYVH